MTYKLIVTLEDNVNYVMKYLLTAFIVLTSSIFLLAQKPQPLISKIAFGSCAEETQPQPILDLVVKHKPDIFVYLGDNIYGDTEDMMVLQAKYDSLAAKQEFQRLKKNVKLYATWDDHDFGWNDAGKYYPFKKESKEMFLKFFDEPANSERRNHDGIYTSYMFEGNGRKLQLILLDNRTFRNNLRLYRGELNHEGKYFYPLDYFPHQIEDSALLGNNNGNGWKKN